MGLYAKISPFDPVVVDWARRVVTNGGDFPSKNTMLAMHDFVKGLRLDAIHSKMLVVGCIVPDSLVAAATPLINSGSIGFDPWTNNNFVSNDLTVNGIKGNGVDKYFDTGINPSVSLNQTDVGLSLYLYDAASSGSIIGGAQSSSPDLILSQNVWDCWNNTTERVLHSTGQRGFYSGNRIASNDSRAYYANSTSSLAQVGSTVTTGTSVPPNTHLGVMADLNNTVTPLFPGDGVISFSAVHTGLSLLELAKFFNRVQILRRGLSGGYV
jgi:hypothetical protein